MTDPFARLRRFLRELKRRNVYQVGVTYVVAAFVVVQLASLAADAFGLPGWFEPMIWVVCGLGFPLALVLAWAFEKTPEGVRRTPEEESDVVEPASGATAWIAALAVLLLAGGGTWYLTADGSEEPGETAATVDTARTGPAATAGTSSRDRPFVAVLPLENLSPDEENAFFADGIHEEVLTQLSKISGLGVKSRTSVMQYENTEKTMEEIARELEVGALMEGSVRRAGDRVRITAQLIDGESGDHLWSETYERELSPDAVFDIQAELAERIAGSLETELTEGEQRRIEEAPTDDLAAYDAYLQGRSRYFEHWATLQPADIRRSIAAFREAIRRDSSFAEAHAWLGSAYAQGAQFMGAEGWVDSASVAVERARRLEPDLAAVHLAQAWIHEARDSTAAQIESLRRALELQPSHALARSRLSSALEADGQYVEALRVAREAVALAPRQPAVLQEMGDQLREVGLWDAAKAWDRHILEIEPRFSEAIAGLAVELNAQGHPGRALATWQRYLEGTDAPFPGALRRAAGTALRAGRPEQARAYLERIPEARRQRRFDRAEAPPERGLANPVSRAFLGLAELRMGNGERGRRLLQQAADSVRSYMEDAEDPPGAVFLLAEIEAGLGQPDRALEHLERWWTTGPHWHPGIVTSPFFDDELRSDPGFQRIVRGIEAEQAKLREEVRRLDLDLYPPGAEPDTASRSSEPSASR